jgi:hypothetical protein
LPDTQLLCITYARFAQHAVVVHHSMRALLDMQLLCITVCKLCLTCSCCASQVVSFASHAAVVHHSMRALLEEHMLCSTVLLLGLLCSLWCAAAVAQKCCCNAGTISAAHEFASWCHAPGLRLLCWLRFGLLRVRCCVCSVV